MLVISSREFRNNQAQYFNRVDNGEKIIVQRGNDKAYALTPISEEDLYFTPEMLEKIELALKQVENGECTVIKGKEELQRYLDNL
jgi:antitoxin (DNA-binding transcriptional repressor) of toxin-antitoxin stability system